MICCIIGKGSIGKRHGEILENLNVKVLFLRRNPNKSESNEISFNYKYLKKINFFIVSNPSSFHLKTIKKIIKFKKPILVEKPFITQMKIEKNIEKYKKIFVLYQMRFDPRIKFLKREITNEKIKKGNFVWKTFLPDWHKNEDYKKSYASRKILGGGVIFTMSHEIDTAIYLIGKVKSVYATKSKNKFNIDVEDNINLKLNHHGNCSSNLKLSFASKKNIRKFNIETHNDNFKWDFFDNKIFFKN
jgi:predicted dehydrogenase